MKASISIKLTSLDVLQGLVIFAIVFPLCRYFVSTGWIDVVEDIAWVLMGSDPNSWWMIPRMLVVMFALALVIKFVFMTRWSKGKQN